LKIFCECGWSILPGIAGNVSRGDMDALSHIAEEEFKSVALKQDTLDRLISEHKAALQELTVTNLGKEQKMVKMKAMTERSKFVITLP
jgi:hypothetical protein